MLDVWVMDALPVVSLAPGGSLEACRLAREACSGGDQGLQAKIPGALKTVFDRVPGHWG